MTSQSHCLVFLLNTNPGHSNQAAGTWRFNGGRKLVIFERKEKKNTFLDRICTFFIEVVGSRLEYQLDLSSLIMCSILMTTLFSKH